MSTNNAPQFTYPESPDPDASYFQSKTKKKFSNYFKPEVPAKNEIKKYIVRLLPNPHNQGFEPFTPIFLHYNVGSKSVVCPKHTNNQPCAICDYIRSVYDKTTDIAESHGIDSMDSESQGKIPEIRKLWDSVKPIKQRGSYYVALLIRGQESDGVKYWRASQTVFDLIYERLTDTKKAIDRYQGYDATVKVKNSGKLVNNRPFSEYDFVFNIEEGRKPVLPKSAEDINEFINSIPNPWELVTVPTFEETKQALTDFIGTDKLEEDLPVHIEPKNNVSSSPARQSQTVATTEGTDSAESVDQMFADMLSD